MTEDVDEKLLVVIGFFVLLTVLALIMMHFDPPIDILEATINGPTETLRDGVGWVHMSTTTRSGKGVSKTRELAREKCRALAAQPLTESVSDIDALVTIMFKKKAILKRRSPIVVSGDLHQLTSDTLRWDLGERFNIEFYQTGVNEG